MAVFARTLPHGGQVVNAGQVAAVPPPPDPAAGTWARALFDGIDDAVFVHDLEGHILEANPAACRRLGYSRAEMLRLTTRDIDDPELAAGYSERLRAQVTQGRCSCEGRHRTKDGRLIPVDINTSAIEFNGRPAVLAVMRDITGRKKTEEALRKQSALIRSVLNSMADAVVVAGERGELLGSNPAAERLFELGPAGSPTAGLAAQCWRNQTTLFPAEEFPLHRAVRGEAVDDVEAYARPPGRTAGAWVNITARPLHAGDGGARGGLMVCHDITARKRAESRQAAQYAVTSALAEAPSLTQAAPRILRVICEALGWDVGALWLADQPRGLLHCAGYWSAPGFSAQEFEAATRQHAFPPGVGVPGRAWAERTAVWIPDLRAEDNFPRAAAATGAGLRAAFAFPVMSAGEVTGVLETFSRAMDRPDDDLLSMLTALGSQIGQVAERERVEKALRDSEAFYHSLVESLPQNIFRKDREGRVTFGNSRYCATLKRPLAEVMGKSDFDLFPPDLATKYRQDDQRVMESGAPFEAVEEHRLPDGTLIYVQVVKTPVRDGTGHVIGTQCIFWDVTERVRAEQAIAASERRYRQLTEATLDAIIVADQEGRVTLFNPAAERLFGYPAAEVVGQPLTCLMPDQYCGQHDAGLRRYVETRVARIVGRTVELHGRRKDGSEFPVELALSAIELDGDPRSGRPPLQFLGALRDLTERNRIRAVLVQNEKLASIGLLSAGVAHEINNPLAFVANNLAVLERDSKGLLALLEHYEQHRDRLDSAAVERARELVEEVDLAYVCANLPRLLARTRDGVDRVTRIVHNLRGLARTDAPRHEDAHLPDLVEGSLELIHGQLKRRGIDIELDYDPVSRVRCVPSQISQVLLNLLVNALQAIEAVPRAEGHRIRVSTRRSGGDMVVEVADTGCGIDPGHLPHLFDPFFTTKDVGQGTGLGLSITHNIVTGHGGRIEVESELGRGTRFRIHLPLTEADRGPAEGARARGLPTPIPLRDRS
jgi:PAS domain S-box-containing protein